MHLHTYRKQTYIHTYIHTYLHTFILPYIHDLHVDDRSVGHHAEIASGQEPRPKATNAARKRVFCSEGTHTYIHT